MQASTEWPIADLGGVHVPWLSWVEATVRFRQERNGEPWPVRPEVLPLDGRRLKFDVSFRLEDDDDRYPGEWAMGIMERPMLAPIAWVASGDLVDIVPLSDEEREQAVEEYLRATEEKP